MAAVVQFGLGAIGTPIAVNFSKAGHTVIAVDPYASQATRDQLDTQQIPLTNNLAEALTYASDVTIVSVLPDSETVAEVATEIARSTLTAALWIDMTSAQPDETVAIATRLADRKIELVDAPICSGGVPGAQAGSMTVCIGGTSGQFDRARHLMQAVAGNIIHAGPVGSGHVIKLLSNYLALGTVALVAEACSIASTRGFEPTQVFDILADCAAASFVHLEQVQRVVTPPDQERPANFRLALARKDMRYLATFAAACGVPAPMAEGAHSDYLAAELMGLHNMEAVQAVFATLVNKAQDSTIND